VLVLGVTAVGCPCVRGAVNDSPEIRWFLFSNFGASKVCPEMLKRGVPLKLQAMGTASVGRFFPQQCQAQVDDQRRVLAVTMSGTGYVVMPFTRRVGFYVGMSVEYVPDFRLESDAIYVWGRFGRFISAPDMRIMGVENSIIGNSLVASEIGRGFTVVRQDSGDDFAIGHLDPPEKPKRQFKAGDDRIVLGSDLTEVRPGSRDYLGPFEVTDKGAALFFRGNVQGAPIIWAVVDKPIGEAWRRGYEQAQPNTPPPGPIRYSGTIAPADFKETFALDPGTYYVVVENTAQTPIAPLGMPLPFPEAVAYVSYNAEIGDRP
jgi:hypothetical protein